MTDDHQRLSFFGFAVYHEMHQERVRAHSKHGAKGNSREDAEWTDGEWLPILMEELGEVAHELTYDVDSAQRKYRLRAELIQLGAMAAAWVTAIDDEPIVDTHSQPEYNVGETPDSATESV
jgi:hypothetical protein